MKHRVVLTSLEEDLKKLGLNIDESCVGEGCKDTSEEDDEEDDEDDEDDDEDDEEGDEKQESLDYGDDFITHKELDDILSLPVDAMTESECQELYDIVKSKRMNSTDSSIVEKVERVINFLQEAAPTRIRRFRAGKTSRRKSFQCPQGFRAVKVGDGKGRPRCVPAHIAAGGMGVLRKIARKKKKWARSGKGKMSFRRSDRAERRRGSIRQESFMSPIAMELSNLMESTVVTSVRDDIIERVSNIMLCLAEEFTDRAVTELYEDAFSGVADMYAAGRLDEDVLNESEFIAAIEPCLTLITSSCDRLDSGMGNE